MGVHATRVGERKDVYGVLVGRHVEKGPLGRPRHIWDDNIKMDIKSGWIVLAEDWDRWRAQVNLLKPTGYVMYQQFNIQQLYVLPSLYF